MKHILEIPDYSSPAIYALVDENGKRYIGSTKNIRNRIRTHDMCMRQTLRGENSGFLSNSLRNALLEGHHFKVEILATFEDADSKDLLKIERACLLAAGGIENTYNSQNIALRRTE